MCAWLSWGILLKKAALILDLPCRQRDGFFTVFKLNRLVAHVLYAQAAMNKIHKKDASSYPRKTIANYGLFSVLGFLFSLKKSQYLTKSLITKFRVVP